MKGDLVLYDSLVWLMGSLEGRPACQGPQTSWQRTASAAEPGSPQPLQALPSSTPSCPSANQCPAVGKLHLPLRIHPWTNLLVPLPCLMFPLDPSLLSPVSAILCMGRTFCSSLDVCPHSWAPFSSAPYPFVDSPFFYQATTLFPCSLKKIFCLDPCLPPELSQLPVLTRAFKRNKTPWVPEQGSSSCQSAPATGPSEMPGD